MGNLEIYVGINGTGKSTELNNKFKEKEKNDSAIFIDSEFKNSDEYKVTKNGAVLSEIFVNKIFNENINGIIDNLKNKIDKNIKEKFSDIEKYFKEINDINNSNFNKELFSYKNNDNKEFILNFLTNQTKIDGEWGSGQKRLLFLKMLEDIDVNNIFIDEPELYCHPNLIKTISQIIFKLLEKGKNVYITTHSPKLLQFLIKKDFKFFNNITFFNKSENKTNENNVSIDIEDIEEKIIKEFIVEFNINDNLLKSNNIFRFYQNNNFWKYINNYSFINFFECLFSNNIFLVEGKNDKIFIEYCIQKNNLDNEDYSICDCDGKFNIPIFYNIFKTIKKNVIVLFDKDENNNFNNNEDKKNNNNLINNYLLSKIEKNNIVYFKENIETDLKYIENENKKIKKKNNIVMFISFLETKNIKDYDDNVKFIINKIISFLRKKL